MIKRGFTLIEVLVTMAIISILAGIMIPAVYRWWESQEEQTTRDRLIALKLAMVGDRSLVQNGIRTNYGFVGEYGELPTQALYTSAGLKKYLGGGYDPATYRKDAWGNSIIYTPVEVAGRNVSGTLKSNGLAAGSPITVDIAETEVTPTNMLQGNLNFNFTTSGGGSKNYAAKIFAVYNDYLGTTPTTGKDRTSTTNCIPVPVTYDASKSYNPVSLPIPANTAFAVKLPVGMSQIYTQLYTDSLCTLPIADTPIINIFVTDSLNVIPLNLPAINYTILP